MAPTPLYRNILFSCLAEKFLLTDANPPFKNPHQRIKTPMTPSIATISHYSNTSKPPMVMMSSLSNLVTLRHVIMKHGIFAILPFVMVAINGTTSLMVSDAPTFIGKKKRIQDK